MKRQMPFKIAGAAAVTAASLLLVMSSIASAAGQPMTETVRGQLTLTMPEAGCNDETVDLTLSLDYRIHLVEFESGQTHVNGNYFADFVWEQGGVTYSGRANAQWADNWTLRTETSSYTLNARGSGSDGSRVSVRAVIHTTRNTQGDVTSSVDLEDIRCG